VTRPSPKVVSRHTSLVYGRKQILILSDIMTCNKCDKFNYTIQGAGYTVNSEKTLSGTKNE